MSAPQLLIDNDILFRLSGAGLLDLALQALGISKSSAFCFSHIPYMINKGRLKGWPTDCINKILADCASLSKITDAPDVSILQVLSSIVGIDEGEAGLYSLAATNSAILLTTGDKKSMKALCASESVKDIRNALVGRVICLEALCLEMINISSVDHVASAFAPLVLLHNGLKVYFGGRTGESLIAIQHYFNDLQNELGHDFLWQSPRTRN